MKLPKPTLDRLLQNWNPANAEAPLEPEVWRRIGRSEERRSRTLIVGLVGVACVAGALIFAHWRVARIRQDLRAQFARQYLELIDPLLQMRANTLDAELAWIRADLKLTPEQFARIKELHASSLRGLLALNQQVVEARQEFDRLEERRRTADEVDFMAFARLTDSQKAIDRQCRDSTLRLVRATASVMTLEQRSRYLRYVEPALAADPASASN
jgi:hypothetical protein